eukprot:TRINITY_DN10322_c0_g1_i1.p1 TRINITY_DN10322_c0_g1~~TRINITY_DN10322_c0_g1_i1.p1  ORF type:complete len:480 (-),score=59.33 TRINITY_DN10322_c0_g1_i1:80-1519(-)
MDDKESLIVVRKPKLTTKTKVLYGFGEVGVYVGAVITGFFLQTFLFEVAKIQTFLSGNILLIGNVWDGISAPWIGKLTDETRTRWGRRRPWLLFGAIPFALCYFLMWITIPPEYSQGARFTYYLIVVLLYNTAGNCISVPYGALTAELATDYNEATTLTMTRMIFSIVGGVIAAYTHSSILQLFTLPESKNLDYSKGYFVSALIFSLFSIIPPLITFFGIREPPLQLESEEPSPKDRPSRIRQFIVIWQDIFGVMKIKPFRILMVIYLISWMCVNLVQNNLYLFTKYVLRRESQFSTIILVVQLSASVSIFIWQQVSIRFGKKTTYYVGISTLIVVQWCLFYVTATSPLWLVYIVSGLAGLGVAIGFLIPWSMLPDVIEYDEYLHDKRREGLFYALFILFQKIGLAVALASSSFVLGAFGYDQNADQPIQPYPVLLALRFIIGPIPAFLLMLSFIFVYLYPLSSVRVQEIRTKLSARNM